MPDYGCPAEDLERHLEQSLAIFPALDYGTSLLARGLPPGTQSPSAGGRKLNGGIMMRSGYKGPTVNIRAPKWTDTTFWIRADNYPEAQYIADAVFYLTGREPFHFGDANFQYPALRLSATRELLTREACAAYVESIAKGAALQKQREDYRERVKELVLKAVKSPEAVLFLSSLRPGARSVPNFDSEENNGGGNDEERHNSAGLPAVEAADEYGVGFPMEIDEVSEQTVQWLVESPCDGPAYIPSFGFDWFDSESILRSDWQSLDHPGWNHSGKKAEEEHMVSSNLKDYLSTLDKEEEELWRSTKSSDWMPWRPVSNTSHHIFRVQRLPYPDCDVL